MRDALERPSGVRVPSLCVSLALLGTITGTMSSARAQEIQLTGCLFCGPPEAPPLSYLPWALRGDLRAMATLGASNFARAPSTSEGFGGALRKRQVDWFALEIDFGVLRGIEDASVLHVPISARAVLIDATRRRPEWDFFAAGGLSYDHVGSDSARMHLFGAEVGIGVDHRIDPRWNRFLVELVLAARHPFDAHDERWTPTAMLRIGIATTMGYSTPVLR
jgi:hypothetical protein